MAGGAGSPRESRGGARPAEGKVKDIWISPKSSPREEIQRLG